MTCRVPQTSSGDHKARLVIGADGRHSAVAPAVGADYTWLRPPATYAYYSYWAGAEVDGIHAWVEPGLFMGLFPTNDHQVLMFYQAPQSRVRRRAARPQRALPARPARPSAAASAPAEWGDH